jgi:hypothetical protein
VHDHCRRDARLNRSFLIAVKRSRRIRLVLIGGLTAGALTGCGPARDKAPVTANSVYTNNYYIAGAGYYHAPFRGWYALPYNYFDPQTRRYFRGGEWAAAPYQTITNISSPTPEDAQQAEARRTDITRGGFGRTSGYHYIHS